MHLVFAAISAGNEAIAVQLAPVNIWLWAYLLGVPAAVFAIRQAASARLRWAALAGLIVVLYFLYFAAWDLHYAQARLAVEASGAPSANDLDDLSADGAKFVFAYFAGWVPGLIYIGLWWSIFRLILGPARRPAAA